MALSIKQIVNFQLKYLRMAGFLEFVQQVLNIVKTYRDSGEAGVSQLPAKVEAAYTPFVSRIEATRTRLLSLRALFVRFVRWSKASLSRYLSPRSHRAWPPVRPPVTQLCVCVLFAIVNNPLSNCSKEGICIHVGC
ncbi:MAG: hypothetical protein J5658_04360 [Prevotella sp.]|nr:hypothetical protein [Prevotella sp.]